MSGPGVDETAGAPAGPQPWLTRNVAVLSGVSFLQDAASELLYPVLPIFLTGVLGAPVAVVGLVEGLAEGTSSVTKVVAGGVADRVGRRPLIAIGYGLAALGKLLVAVALAWPVVLVGRCVDRLGKGVRGAPRDALLVTGVPVAVRGRVFGLHRAADTLGAVVGPLLGLAAYEALDRRLRPLFFVAVLPAALSALLVAAVREDRRPRPAAGQPLLSAAAFRALPAGYWRVVGLLTAFGLVNFPDALLLLRARALGWSVTSVLLGYVAYNCSYALLSFPAGALSDRVPRPLVFATGLGFFAVGYLGLGLVHSAGWVWLLLPAYGGFAACTDGVGKAWVSGLVPDRLQGAAQGLFQGLTGLAVLVAGVWAGLAWSGDGRRPLLLSGAVGLLVAGVLLAGWLTGRPTPRRAVGRA